MLAEYLGNHLLYPFYLVSIGIVCTCFCYIPIWFLHNKFATLPCCFHIVIVILWQKTTSNVSIPSWLSFGRTNLK
jgi:hypothetical protein